MPKPKHAGRDIMTFEEAKSIIDQCKKLKFKALFAMLYLTGARISELTKSYETKYDKKTKKSVRIGKREGIKRENIVYDEEDIYITIPIRKKRSAVIRHTRTLVMSKKSPFVPIILEYIKDMKPEDVLFPFTREYATQVFSKLDQKAWLHLYRHTRLTRLSMIGASPEELRNWAGHGDYRYLDRYLQKMPIKKFKDLIT